MSELLPPNRTWPFSLLACSLFSSSLLWLCPVFPTPTPALPRGRCSAWTLADVSVAAGHTDRSGLGSVLRDLVKPGDENLREMNKKLQNMLEEQLTKNMHLHKASVDHQPAHPSLQPPASLPTQSLAVSFQLALVPPATTFQSSTALLCSPLLPSNQLPRLAHQSAICPSAH
jgi:hypothetical protein